MGVSQPLWRTSEGEGRRPPTGTDLSPLIGFFLVALYVSLGSLFLVLSRAAEPLSFDSEVDLRLAGLGLLVLASIDAAYSAVVSPALLLRRLSPGLCGALLRQGRVQLEMLTGLLSLAALLLCCCGHLDFLGAGHVGGAGDTWFTWQLFLHSTWLSFVGRLTHRLCIHSNVGLKEGLSCLQRSPLSVPLQLLYHASAAQWPSRAGDRPLLWLADVLRQHSQSEAGSSGPAAMALADEESLRRLLATVQRVAESQRCDSVFSVSAVMHNTALSFSELSPSGRADHLISGLPCLPGTLCSAVGLAATCPWSLLAVAGCSALSTLLASGLCAGIGRSASLMSTATLQWTVEEYLTPVAILCGLFVLLGAANWLLDRSVINLSRRLAEGSIATLPSSSGGAALAVSCSVHSVVCRPAVILCTSMAVLLRGSWQGCLVFALCASTDIAMSVAQHVAAGSRGSAGLGTPTALSAGLGAVAALAVTAIGFVRLLEGGDPSALAGEVIAGLLLTCQMSCSNAQLCASLAQLHWALWLGPTEAAAAVCGEAGQHRQTLDTAALTKKLLAAIDSSEGDILI